MRALAAAALSLVLLISQAAAADIVQVLSPTQLVIPAGNRTIPVQLRVLEPEPARQEATAPEPAAGLPAPPSGGGGQDPAPQVPDDQQDSQNQEDEQTANGDAAGWRDLRVATVEASHGGQPIEPSAFQVTWQPEGATSRGVLAITVDETRTRETGAYPIKIEITRGQQPELQDLELTLTRPAAAAGVVQPVKVERIVTHPWWIALQPATVPIEETTGKAALDASSEKSLIALQQDGRLVGNLTATLPGAIAPGAKGTLAFASVDDLPLGDSSGTLTLRAPQLEDGKTVLSIEVSSRWSRFWILPPLLLGILAGFYVRVTQDNRRIRAEALLGLAQEGQRIEGLIAATPDQAHRDALAAERAKLVQEAARARATPDEITSKVSEVRAAVDALLAAFAQRRTAAQTMLDVWRAAAEVLEAGVPELDGPLRGLRSKRQELAILLAEGWLGKVEGIAEDELTRALDAFWQAADGWQSGTDGELQRVQATAWPETDLETVVAKARDASANARNALGAGVARDQLAGQLAGVRALAMAVRSGLANALRQVSQLCENVRKELAERRNPALEQPLAELEEGVNAVNAVATGLEQGATTGLATCLQRLRDKYQAALARAQDAAEAELEAPAGARADLGLAGILRDAVRGLPAVRETAAPGDWHLEITGEDEARVGGDIELRASAAAADRRPEAVRFVWTVDGRPAAADPAEPARLRWRPGQPGRAVVRVEAVALANGERRVAERVLDVLPAVDLPSIADQLATIRRADYLQTGVAGVIVAVIGYTIFAPTFVGGLLALVAPFLWGFGADLGLAKVREYSQPLLNLKPTFPGVPG